MDRRNDEFNQRLRAEAKPRAEVVIRLRRAGQTWAEIGRILGVSRQRAQALAARYLRRPGKGA